MSNWTEQREQEIQARALLTVDEDMVERAARALYLQEIAWSSKAEWDRLPDPVKKMWHLKARAVLDAALNPREGS